MGKRNRSSKLSAKWVLYFILILFVLYSLFPFLWVILNSFKDDIEIFTGKYFPQKLVWQNYPGAWNKIGMGRFYINSIVITTFVVIIGLLVDTLAGYSFARLAVSRHKWVFFVYVAAIAIPLEASAFSIYVQIRRLGLINNSWGVIIALVGTETAFGTFLMRNFFRDLPGFIGESAKIDGASDTQIFSHIYLPLVGPALSTLAIFKLMAGWNDFNISLFLLLKQQFWTIPLGVMVIQQSDFTNYGYVFSVAVMSFLPVIVLTLIFNRSFISGIAAGSVKE